MQAKVVLNPLFGEIKDSIKRRALCPVNLTSKTNCHDTIFTTSATPISPKAGVSTESKLSQRNTNDPISAFTKPYIFDQGEHSMVQCKKLSKLLHNEKIDLFCVKGLCFSCLKPGHMSKSYTVRAACCFTQVFCMWKAKTRLCQRKSYQKTARSGCVASILVIVSFVPDSTVTFCITASV